MRLPAIFFALGLLCRLHAQIALDDLFICERWLLNAEASVLDAHGVDHLLVHEHAERIRTYALDEPYYWERRIFLRIDPKENSALTASVPADSIVPFVRLVNEAIAAGEMHVFNDLDYVGSDTVRGKEPVVEAPMILKVDFHLDTLTQLAVPHLVGLSVERPGGGYAHLYYPELGYVLRRYRVRTKEGLLGLDDHFKAFRFKATWLGCERIADPVACTPRQPSLEQQSELDALSELYLLERALERDGVLHTGKRSFLLDLHPFGPLRAHVVFDAAGRLAEADLKRRDRPITSLHFQDGRPHGPYRAFHPDGHLREEGLFAEGLREGPWNSWYPGGSIRAHRTYKHGRLQGEQQVYHPNGQLWLEYGMANGEYEGPHKTWYPDGELQASGAMHAGVISGEWDYAIRLSRPLMEELTRNNGTRYHLPEGAWLDGVLNYHVSVTTPDPGTHNPTQLCIHDRCIGWAFSEVR